MKLKRIILYLSVFAIQGLSNSVIPVLPELAGASSASSAASNLLFSGYFMGALLALIPFGILADRIGNMKIIGFAVFLTLFSGLIITYFDNLWILGIARFFEGVGGGAFFPAAFSMLAEWKDSQRSLGEFNFLLNGGLAAGVIFSGSLAGFGIKTAISFFTFLTGIAFIFFLLEMGEIISSQQRKKEFTLSTKTTYEKDLKGYSLLFELKNYLKKAQETILKSSFGKIWGIAVLIYATTGILTASYPGYSADFLTKPQLGLAISASYLAAMLSSLIAGRMKMNCNSIVRGGIILTGTGILLAVKTPVLAFTFIGAGGGIAIVGLISATAKISSSGFAMGLFNTAIYAGLGLGPILGGLFLGALDYETLFFGSAFILLSTLYVKLE